MRPHSTTFTSQTDSNIEPNTQPKEWDFLAGMLGSHPSHEATEGTAGRDAGGGFCFRQLADLAALNGGRVCPESCNEKSCRLDVIRL